MHGGDLFEANRKGGVKWLIFNFIVRLK
jgi:hypothetical protein